MVDMRTLTGGAISLTVVVVILVVGVVMNDKIGEAVGTTGADGNETTLGYAIENGTGLLGDFLVDWGAIVVLGVVLVAVLAPLLFALIQVGRQGGSR